MSVMLGQILRALHLASQNRVLSLNGNCLSPNCCTSRLLDAVRVNCTITWSHLSSVGFKWTTPVQECECVGTLQRSVAALRLLSHSDWRCTQHPQAPRQPSHGFSAVRPGPLWTKSCKFSLMHCDHNWGRIEAPHEWYQHCVHQNSYLVSEDEHLGQIKSS